MDDNSNTRYNMFAYMSLAEEISKTMSKNIRLKVEAGAPVDQLLDKTLILDSSPGNFNALPFSKLVSFVPNVKAILIMREPVDRLFSYFRFSAQVPARKNIPCFKNQTAEGFHEYVTDKLRKSGKNAFAHATYNQHVVRLLDITPRKNIAFVQYEEFIKAPVDVIERDILPMLDLEPYSADKSSKILNNQRTNPSSHKYKMLPATRELMKDYFREYNHKLSVTLNDKKWTWGY